MDKATGKNTAGGVFKLNRENHGNTKNDTYDSKYEKSEIVSRTVIISSIFFVMTHWTPP